MGLSHVMGPHRAVESGRTDAARRGGRRLATAAVTALLLATLTVVAVVAGPARAAGSDPASAAPAAQAASEQATSEQAAADLAASLKLWPLAAPATTGYGSPAAQEDDVVIYNRADLYWEIHISLTGNATPYQIGQQYARAMTQADWWWWKKVYLYLTLAPLATHVSYGDMVARALVLKQTVSPEVRGYVEGMASVISSKSLGLVNENDCWVLNLYPDVARPSMCSALGAWGHYTQGGKPIVGRDLDWSDDIILPTLNAVTVYHDGSKSFCSLGYLGLWEVISGFNASGLFGGILDAETGAAYPKLTDQRSYPMDLRTALQTTTTIKDAAAVLQKNKYCFNHQILLADKTRVGILENDLTSTGAWARKVRFDNTPLNAGITWGFRDAVCAVNSFLSKGNDSGRFKTQWNAERWKAYTAQMKMVGTMTVAKMKDIIWYGDPDSTTRPYNSLTTMMMVYQPASGHLDLFMKPRSGGLPENPKWQSIDIDFGAKVFGGRWVREWQAPGWEVVDAVVQRAANGDVVTAAQLSKDGGAEKAVGLVRYRADGKLLWHRIIDPAGADDAQLAGLALSPGAVVVGATQTTDEGSTWLLTRFTARGAVSWRIAGDTGAGNGDSLGGIVCDARGNVYAGGGATAAAAGQTAGAGVQQDWRLRKYSPAGKQLWQRVLASDAGLTEQISGVARLGDSTIITGPWNASATPRTGEIGAARIGDGGKVRWFTAWKTADLEAPAPTGLAARASGIAICGCDAGQDSQTTGDTPASGPGRCALRLDPATGKVEWTSVSQPDAAGGTASYHDVAIDAYGNVSAAGATTDSVAGSASGLISWFNDQGVAGSETYGGAGTANAAEAVTAGPGGLTYVTGGFSAKDASPAMTTTCWEPGGVLRWVISYEGDADEDPACQGYDLSQRGVKLYVAGGSDGALVTAKYDVSTTPLEDSSQN